MHFHHQLDLVRVGHLDVVVDPRRADTGLAGPRVDIGARLTRAHVADARFVPQVAYLRVVAALRAVLLIKNTVRHTVILTTQGPVRLGTLHRLPGGTYRIVTLERLELVDAGQGRRVADPLQGLPVGDDPDVLHRVDRVQELYEAFLMVRLREPGGVIVQSEWCPVGRVVPFEVLHDHLVHVLGVGRVRAGVTHRAAATVQVLPHHHRDFPNTCGKRDE